MKSLSKQVEINVSVTEVAHLFCNMDDREQSAFFNEVAHNVKNWKTNAFDLQAHSISENGFLTDAAKHLIKTLNEFINH
ncbi:MAG: hypothetical protein ABIU30_18485 [Ferruginibacter sp.]